MKDIITVESELVATTIKPAEVFVPGGLDILINEIKTAAKREVEGLDPSTDKDRKAYGTTCRKISSSKVFVETAMKAYVSDLKAKIKPVDTERIRFVAAMEDIRREIDKPRQEYLRAEEETVAAANRVMRQIQDSRVILMGTTASDLGVRIGEIENINPEELPEDYRDMALTQKNEALTLLYQQQADLQKRETEQSELARLRQEAEEQNRKEEQERLIREQAERDERIRQEAEAKAKREAEESAETERQKKEAELTEAKAAAEKAERDRLQAIEQARIDKENAVKETEQKAKEEAERVERARLEKEAEAKAAAERERMASEKKAANARHRAKINTAIASSVAEIGIPSELCYALIDAINDRKIPHMGILY
jgi:hypothetical protein